ncbi:MAG: acyl--CoA ligase [Firmicutes bacterium]|nr:acyl--CoA ligase [Bacillota bacterium]
MGTIDGMKLGCYDLDGNRSFSRIDRNADEFMFGLHHGKQREEIAIDFIGAHTTYHQLDAEVERTARALFAYGIRQGDTVTIVMPNLKETVVYMYACWRIGAVANMLDPRTNSEGILERTERAKAKLFVTVFNICGDKIDPILDRISAKNVILISPSDSMKGCIKPKPLLGSLVFDQKKRVFARSHGMDAGGKYIWNADFLRAYHTDELDVRAAYRSGMAAAIVYTSGTSADGLMKGAVITHRALNAATVGLSYSVKPEDRRRQDTFGGFIPFFSSYGLFNGMHASLCGGLRIILVPLFDPAKFADMLLKTKPNSFLGVPRFHEQLADHPKLQKKNNKLAFIRNPVSGGDKISLASIERINKTFARSGCRAGLRIGYGSTELGACIAVMPSYDPETSDFPWRAEGNVGYIMPQCKAIVIDPDTDEPLPFGEDGELAVHSLCQMEGYYGCPKETEEITYIAKDGTKYYRMGDKGRLDENGCFYFLDRYKRSLMRPDGHTVHPAPIENVIMRHEAVEKCAVAGLSLGENQAGSIPSAFVVLREGYGGTAEENREVLANIDELCLKYLPERDRAFAYRTVKELPYTPMGKVDFRALEKEIFDPAKFLLRDFAFFPELRNKP